MQEPLVSINCITYNHEKFIRQTLDGFIMQQTDFPFEVIIHDDVSTDHTTDIIREYEEKYPDIIKPIYQTENQFSKGIAMIPTFTYPQSKGKYVATCEGDDYWTDPLKLQKQVDFLDTHPECSICFHPVKKIYDDGSKPDEFFPSSEYRFYKAVLSLDDLVQRGFMATNSVMYRRMLDTKELLNDFPKNILFGDWWLHILHAEKGLIGYIDEIMGVYRKHSGGIAWQIEEDRPEHSRKYGFKTLEFYRCIDKHLNYHYTEPFTAMATNFAENMIIAFLKHNEYNQIKKLRDEYRKYYLSARPLVIKRIISAPERYIRHTLRFRLGRK